jgi:hypothetical protein
VAAHGAWESDGGAQVGESGDNGAQAGDSGGGGGARASGESGGGRAGQGAVAATRWQGIPAVVVARADQGSPAVAGDVPVDQGSPVVETRGRGGGWSRGAHAAGAGEGVARSRGGRTPELGRAPPGKEGSA